MEENTIPEDALVIKYAGQTLSLYLSNTKVSDISALGRLTKLKVLDLRDTEVSNDQIYELFVRNENRENLMVWNSKNEVIRWADVPGEYKQPVKEELSFEKQIDVAYKFLLKNNIPKSALTVDTTDQTLALNLNDAQVNDITALGGLTHLTKLYLPLTQVSDITALEGLTNLKFYQIRAHT